MIGKNSEFNILYPNKYETEGPYFLGIDFFYYDNKRRSLFREIMVHEKGFYLLIDLFWYRMGIHIIFDTKETKITKGVI